MRIRVARPTPSMVVSVLALSVAMGGTSYAATMIGSHQIKDNSIRSRDVLNNTLKGRDISESTLGKVPSAAKVDRFRTFNVGMNRGDARVLLTKVGPVSLYGTCEEDAGNARGSVQAETTAAHTYTYDDHDLNPGEVVNLADLTDPPETGTFENWTSYEPMFFSGQAGGSFDGDGESAGIIIGGPGAECRFVGALPLIPVG